MHDCALDSVLVLSTYYWNPTVDLIFEFTDPVFVKTIPNRSFSITENEQFGLVSRVYKLGHRYIPNLLINN
jgi:hypothetical protein